MVEMRKQYIEENGYAVVEMWESEWWKLCKADMSVKEHLRKPIPYKRPLRQNQLSYKIISGALPGYVEGDIKVPGYLREQFANFLPIFKIKNVCRQDIRSIMHEYAEKEWLKTQLRPTFFSSFEQTNAPIIAPLLIFYLELGLVSTKTYRFVEYTPVKCFDNVVSIRCHSSSSKRQQYPLRCSCRNCEVACKQLGWLSIYGAHLQFSYKVYY